MLANSIPLLWGVEMDGSATAATPSTGPLTNSFSSGGFIQLITGYLNSTGSNSSGTLLDPIENVLYDFSANSSRTGNVSPGDISVGTIDNAQTFHVFEGQTYSSTADSSLNAHWFDTLTFGGAPFGTPLDFNVTSVFDPFIKAASYPSTNGGQILYSLTFR